MFPLIRKGIWEGGRQALEPTIKALEIPAKYPLQNGNLTPFASDSTFANMNLL